MAYCSLEEAYGSDFAKQVNNQYAPSKMNPTRNRADLIKHKKQEAVKQSEEDTDIHYGSFKDVSKWNDELSPKEFLKQSLLRDRKIKKVKTDNYEPSGYSEVIKYSSLETDPCNDYFYHLDTCRRCQARLKKRISNYMKTIKGEDLFIDQEVKDVKEDFTNKKDLNSVILLLLFGLFTMYTLDTSSRLVK
jgi:hypothetical protein